MGSDLGVKFRFGVTDGLSGAIDKARSKFPGLANAIKGANNQFKVLNKSTEGFNKSMKKIGGGLKNAGTTMSIGLTAPIVAFGASVINTSKEFEQSMNDVAAKSGATGQVLEDLKKRAREMGANTAFSAKEAADSMAFLAQAGWSTKQIFEAIPAVLDLAAASGTSLAEAGDIASNIMGAFNIEATDASRVADVLAKTTASSNVNMIQLAEAMKDAGPVAQKYGLTLEETSALIGKLGDAGIQGSKAGTTLKNMFLNLSAPTSSMAKQLSDLGVKTFDKTTGKMRSMTTILAEMDKGFKMKNIGSAKKLAILNDIFGARAIAGAGVLMDQIGKVGTDGVNSIDAFTEALNGSKGASKSMADTMMKGLPGALKTLESKFMEFQLAIMDPSTGLSQAFGDIVTSISDLLGWLSKLNPTVLAMGAKIALVVAVMGPFLFILGSFLAMIPNLVMAFNLLKIGFIALKAGAASALVPLLPYIALFALLATSAYMVYKAWEPIKSFFADIFTSPLQQLKDMIGWVGKLSGISSLFGFGDNTDEELRKQGFKIQDSAPSGAPVGSKEVTQKTNTFETRAAKAQVGINFSNMPKGTRVNSDDGGNILDITSGSMVGGL